MILAQSVKDVVRAWRSAPWSVRASAGLTALLTAVGAALSAAVLPPPALAPLALAAIGAQTAVFVGLTRTHRMQAARLAEGLVLQLSRPREVGRKGSLYDGVSGLYSRWYFELRLGEEARRCDRYGLSMAVIAIRISGLDLELLSTESWERIVTEMGRAAAQTVRAVDVVAALGGPEFAICLVHCDRAGAEAVKARLFRGLAPAPTRIGYALYPDDPCEVGDLIGLARQRLQPATVTEAA